MSRYRQGSIYMRYILETILAAGVLLLLLGCGRKFDQPQRRASVLASIRKVDLDPDHYGSYSQYSEQIYREIKAIVDQVPSPSDLKGLFYECVRLEKGDSATSPQEKLQWTSRYWEASEAILFRLADLKSDSATRALVELCVDSSLSWDGEGALDICNAISR